MEHRTRAIVLCENKHVADLVWCLFSEGDQHLEEWSEIPAIGRYGDNLLSMWGS